MPSQLSSASCGSILSSHGSSHSPRWRGLLAEISFTQPAGLLGKPELFKDEDAQCWSCLLVLALPPCPHLRTPLDRRPSRTLRRRCSPTHAHALSLSTRPGKTPLLSVFPGVISKAPAMRPLGGSGTLSLRKQGVVVEATVGLGGQRVGSIPLLNSFVP